MFVTQSCALLGQIIRHPSCKTSVSTIKVLGKSQQSQPFSIHSGLPKNEQVLVTNPVASKIYLCALSDDYSSITICRNIESPELSHPIDCLYFADDVIVVTGGGVGGGLPHETDGGDRRLA